MPDHGERPSEEFERNLERTLEATYEQEPSDYGSTLLSPVHHLRLVHNLPIDGLPEVWNCFSFSKVA